VHLAINPESNEKSRPKQLAEPAWEKTGQLIINTPRLVAAISGNRRASITDQFEII
jgi:hypothetical protein